MKMRPHHPKIEDAIRDAVKKGNWKANFGDYLNRTLGPQLAKKMLILEDDLNDISGL